MASELKYPPERPQRVAGNTLPILIRSFDRAYETAVRDLFTRCIHEIAPPSAQVEVESYIARALAGDYRDIAAHYAPGRGRGFWLALSPADDLIGTFALQPSSEDVAELCRMYVNAGFRRRGVARTMLARAEALCAEWGFRRLFLTTSSLNQAAVALYRAAGFERRDFVPENAAAEPPPDVRVFAFEKALSLPLNLDGLAPAMRSEPERLES